MGSDLPPLPMISAVSPFAAALVGLVAGLLLGAAVVVTILRRQPPDAPATVGLHEDLQPILDALRAAVAVVGPHDELVAVNGPAEQLGLVRAGRVAIPAVLELVRNCRRDGLSVVTNVDHVRGPGRPPLRLAVRVLPLADERVFLVAEDRDRTLRGQASGRDFMTNVTHELKTPIGAISLLAEAIEDAADDPDDVLRFAGRIGAEASRLTDLVQQIITLSRLQSHPARASSVPLPIDDVVDAALARCREQAAGRDVTLTASRERGLWVRGDADQLIAALRNLIENAINYSDAGARVVVTTRPACVDGEDLVEIAVSDNGIGIAPEDQRRIFERFYRVDAARSRATGGTGLGLSIVDEIAAGHDGSVSVWSSPGSGSTFTLRLPQAAPDHEAESQ